MSLNSDRAATLWKALTACILEPESLRQTEPKTLVLAAHPDDETIGASLALSRLPNCSVAFLTDGAPRKAQYRSAGESLPKGEYARLRQTEALHALAFVGLQKRNLYHFDCIDQEAIYNIPGLLRRLLSLIRELKPQVVITHAYEGGHPDHDAVALIAHLAAASQPDVLAPLVVEMALYHAHNNHLVTQEFLPNAGEGLVCGLSSEEQERKRAMFACYRSQAAVLRSFQRDCERFRPAPAYDFSKPPHDGRLWYECLGWMPGESWRSTATTAIAAFGDLVCH
jgi:LmbE family N-acetylglucosaminyl deacetylase